MCLACTSVFQKRSQAWPEPPPHTPSGPPACASQHALIIDWNTASLEQYEQALEHFSQALHIDTGSDAGGAGYARSTLSTISSGGDEAPGGGGRVSTPKAGPVRVTQDSYAAIQQAEATLHNSVHAQPPSSRLGVEAGRLSARGDRARSAGAAAAAAAAAAGPGGIVGGPCNDEQTALAQHAGREGADGGEGAIGTVAAPATVMATSFYCPILTGEELAGGLTGGLTEGRTGGLGNEVTAEEDMGEEDMGHHEVSVQASAPMQTSFAVGKLVVGAQVGSREGGGLKQGRGGVVVDVMQEETLEL